MFLVCFCCCIVLPNSLFTNFSLFKIFGWIPIVFVLAVGIFSVLYAIFNFPSSSTVSSAGNNTTSGDTARTIAAVSWIIYFLSSTVLSMLGHEFFRLRASKCLSCCLTPCCFTPGRREDLLGRWQLVKEHMRTRTQELAELGQQLEELGKRMNQLGEASDLFEGNAPSSTRATSLSRPLEEHSTMTGPSSSTQQSSSLTAESRYQKHALLAHMPIVCKILRTILSEL